MPRPALTRLVASLPLAAAIALPATAGAADLRVASDGRPTCAAGTDACSLAAALSIAAGDDRIILAPGVYGDLGSLSDRPASRGVTIIGQPGEPRPVLDLSTGTLRLTHGTSLAGVDIVSGDGTALEVAGGLVDRVRAIATGPSVTALSLGRGAVLRNSVVVATGSAATAVAVSADPAGSVAVDPAPALRGATVLASGSGASALRVTAAEGDATALRAVNTILEGRAEAADLTATAAPGASATVELDHVATDPARHVLSGDVRLPSLGILTLPPTFTDAAARDLRQTAASPTIDAGTADLDGDGAIDDRDVEAAGATDLDGHPRRLGTPDLGADEREMPPLVLATVPSFDEQTAAIRVVVQPRGLATDVYADVAFDGRAEWRTGAFRATGNDPVPLTLPLGAVPAGARSLRVRVHAASDAGSVAPTVRTFVVPDGQAPSLDVRVSGLGGEAAPSATPVVVGAPSRGGTVETTTVTAVPAVRPRAIRLPGKRPTLLATSARQQRGQFAFRLRCERLESCRGTVLLTRLGKVRSDVFRIPPGQTRTVRLTLTSAQADRVRRSRSRGTRALLEVRSTDEGSTWTAVRLRPARRR